MKPVPLQPGFALVEALVALTLLSVALAGSALLLVQAVLHERVAAERSRALRHAGSLADALRVLERLDGQPLQAVAQPGAVPDCPLYPVDCLTDADAARRIDDWRAAVTADLPAGVAALVRWLPAPTAAYLVTVAWPTSGETSQAVVRLPVEP